MTPTTRKTATAKTTTERKYPHMRAITTETLNADAGRSSGRKASKSLYHDDMAEAIKEPHGTPFAIDIPEGGKATTVTSQLRIAAKAHDVKIKIFVRDKATPPYVGFSVLAPEEASK